MVSAAETATVFQENLLGPFWVKVSFKGHPQGRKNFDIKTEGTILNRFVKKTQQSFEHEADLQRVCMTADLVGFAKRREKRVKRSNSGTQLIQRRLVRSSPLPSTCC